MDKFRYASDKPKKCRIFYDHRNHDKAYALSCLEQLENRLFQGPTKSKVTTQIKLAQYATDAESVVNGIGFRPIVAQ